MEVCLIEDPDPRYTGRGVFYCNALKPLANEHENISEISVPPVPDPDNHPARYFFPGYARESFHDHLQSKWVQRLRRKIEEASKQADQLLIPHHALFVADPQDLQSEVVPFIHDISPVTSIFADQQSYRENKKRIERVMACDTVICASRATESDVLQRTPYQGQTRVVYQGVDNITSVNEQIERDIDLLYVGALHERKDPEFTRSVIQEAQNAGFSCLAVNSKQIEVPCEVETGVSGDDLATIFKRSRFYLHPSRIEGFGRTPVEAQSQGVFPLARDIPINHEVLGTVGQSWYSISSTEEVLDKLQSDLHPSTRERVQENANRFRWESTRSQILEIVGVDQ